MPLLKEIFLLDWRPLAERIRQLESGKVLYQLEQKGSQWQNVDSLSGGYGWESKCEGRGFKSKHHLLDGHFSTLICCTYCKVCLNRPKINEEVSGNGPFKKVDSTLWRQLPILFYNVSPHEVVLVEARVVAAMARFPSQRHIFRSSVSFENGGNGNFSPKSCFRSNTFCKNHNFYRYNWIEDFWLDWKVSELTFGLYLT